MNIGDDLVVKLSPPSFVFRAEEEEGGYRTQSGEFLRLSTSAWVGVPDLLVENGRLVGLTFYVNERLHSKVQVALLSWDEQRSRLIPADSVECVTRYPHRFVKGSYLEVLLAGTGNDQQMLAQLDFASCNWLWNKSDSVPVGLAVHDVEELAVEHGVALTEAVA